MKNELLKAVKNFADAADELNKQWTEAIENGRPAAGILTNSYPFGKCFRETTDDIKLWATAVEVQLTTMVVTSTEYIDTGGNIQIIEMMIEGGGELKSITINEECIVGRSKPYYECEGEQDEIWIATNYEELRGSVQMEIAIECIRQYNNYINKYNCDNILGL